MLQQSQGRINGKKATVLELFLIKISPELMKEMNAYLAAHKDQFQKKYLGHNKNFSPKITLFEDILIITTFKLNQQKITDQKGFVKAICDQMATKIHRKSITINERICKKISKLQVEDIRNFMKKNQDIVFDKKKLRVNEPKSNEQVSFKHIQAPMKDKMANQYKSDDFFEIDNAQNPEQIEKTIQDVIQASKALKQISRVGIQQQNLDKFQKVQQLIEGAKQLIEILKTDEDNKNKEPKTQCKVENGEKQKLSQYQQKKEQTESEKVSQRKVNGFEASTLLHLLSGNEANFKLFQSNKFKYQSYLWSNQQDEIIKKLTKELPNIEIEMLMKYKKLQLILERIEYLKLPVSEEVRNSLKKISNQGKLKGLTQVNE